MRVGIIGSGRIGGTLGKLWARAGHSVLFSSRHPEELAALAADASHGARIGTPRDAAGFGDVVVLAVPSAALPALLQGLGGLTGRIVIDTSNTLGGGIAELAGRAGGAVLVKAFNTLPSRTLAREGGGPEAERPVIFHATDDERAKAVVAQLIRDAGFAPVAAGGLADAARQEPGGRLYNRELTAEDAAELLARPRGDPAAADDRTYFEQLTRAVFQAGTSWRAVEATWDGVRGRLCDFHPHAVAALAPPEIAEDPRKVEATVANARTAVALIAQHGSFRAYLRSFASPQRAIRDLEERFAGLGRGASRWFLHSVGEPTPSE